MHRRLAALAVLLVVVLLAGCGGTTHHPPKTVPLPPSVKKACPEALNGQGSMGECAPATPAATGSTKALRSSAGAGGVTYPDFSNNDPCYCAAQLKAHGQAGEIDKVNQGIGFLDSTFYRMATEAKAHGLAVGGYDFDQEYTASEAYTLVGRLHAAGIWRNTPRTFPPTLDVEFGVPSRAGLERQLAVLFHEYGRAQIYTGAWYWLPHFGCWVPPHVAFWLSGYPIAQLLCGLSPVNWQAHQFTDHGYTGASQVPFADLTLYIGRSFSAFTQSGPTTAQTRASKVKSLHAHERLRAELHADIEHHHCRRGQHATPREPLATRKKVHDVLCPSWIKRGGEAIKVIHRYERQGIR